MQQTVVTVEGRFEHHRPAERGTVTLAVGFEGPARDDVVRRTTELHARVVEQVRAMHAPSSGPVTWWSSDRMSVGSRRPWNNEGKQLPLVHHAAVRLEVKFSDLGRLAAWVEQVSALDGVTMQGVRWTLTEATRRTLTLDARRRAVADALDRARVYAGALGLTDVRAVAVAEPGMLSDAGRPTGVGESVAAARTGKAAGDGAGLELKPEDITVAAAVHARFAAS
ncbi:SIMPL domain-containing protein [Cellulomonas palmilytica]|uniref:SIMPL domain-containing protein n=1 Tax=Cellulomonas palmilytica TaxID=2608402 RepID=UPI001F2B96C2|nr:SIMPL domain-containing protein [Cellulomonas palmilytica]UJP40969.1 SIMPL domain-containing protein [Cellulomonas palmilytica]